MVLRELEQGHPIICSMRKGTFTAQGHFIVLAGVKDGKILVRDPNSRAKSEMLWDFSEIRSQIRNLWRYVVSASYQYFLAIPRIFSIME